MNVIGTAGSWCIHMYNIYTCTYSLVRNILKILGTYMYVICVCVCVCAGTHDLCYIVPSIFERATFRNKSLTWDLDDKFL